MGQCAIACARPPVETERSPGVATGERGSVSLERNHGAFRATFKPRGEPSSDDRTKPRPGDAQPVRAPGGSTFVTGSRDEDERGRRGGRHSVWERDVFFAGTWSEQTQTQTQTLPGGGGVGGEGGDGEARPPMTLLEASARRVARHYEAGLGDRELVYAKLRSFAKAMPQRADRSARTADREVPTAPKVLAEAAEAALHGQDDEWAGRQAVIDLLAPEVVYNTMDGERLRGREATVRKMNDTMTKMMKRMRRSSSRRDGKSMRHVKMRMEGPTYAGGGVWIMAYTFEVMLMKIKVREEFVMDEQGRIKELTRIRM